MVRKLVMLLLLSVSIGNSCNKQTIEDPFTGDSTVLLNGESFNFRMNAILRDKKFSIHMAHLINGSVRMETGFHDIPAAPGSYAISGGYLSTLLGGDVALDDYNIFNNSINELAVTAINAEKNELTGTYTLAFIRDTTFGPKRDIFPDTMYFTQGSFKVRYEERF